MYDQIKLINHHIIYFLTIYRFVLRKGDDIKADLEQNIKNNDKEIEE